MSDFTYEAETRKTPLETYEWDNVWLEQTEKTESLRILYVGDSISCGARRNITARSGEKYMVDGFGTSKAVDNPYFIPALRLFASQQCKRDAILFNNGLHGFHLSTEEYEKHYDGLLRFFKTEYPKTPVLVVLTTDTNEDDKLRRKAIKDRNEIAVKLAGKYGFTVVDLFSLSVENAACHTPDKVHFTPDGYNLIADKIIEALDKIFKIFNK